MIPYSAPAHVDTLPVLDLAPWIDGTDRASVAHALHQHAQVCGFFYLANHGIPQNLTAAVLEQTRIFFNRPVDELMQLDISQSPVRRGYEPMAWQTLDIGSAPDLKESFFIGTDLGPEHPYVREGVPGYGANRWLPDSAPGLTAFRPTIEAYYAQVKAVTETLLGVFALAMELPEDHFNASLRDPIATLRLIHYPPQPAKAERNQIGCGAHTDWGALTLLLQDSTGGLEVCDASGQWIAARPIDGTLLVNFGDMMPRWTNGLYHSNLHRVKNASPERHRYSVAFFHDLNYHARVECLPAMRPPVGEPLYPPCTVGEHIEEMYRRTFGAVTAKASA